MDKKVLIVEDDPPFITLIQLALRDMNFDFDVAREGNTALDRLSKSEYDLAKNRQEPESRLPNSSDKRSRRGYDEHKIRRFEFIRLYAKTVFTD